VEHFVDRETESQALGNALMVHVARCDFGKIDSTSFLNVVSFYGIGGIGKTALSARLQTWLNGGIRLEDWKEPPDTRNLHTVRWELNDSQGNLDTIPLLLSVRSELHRHKRSWPAFDLAFAAYFTAIRPGESLPVAGLQDTSFVDGFTTILGDIAEDLGHANVVAGLTASTVRAVINAAKLKAERWLATRTNPGILELLDRCISEPSADDQHPEIAAEVLWQLSLEIDNMSNDDRPNLVVFIDHFERVQRAIRGSGERTLNRFVACLPYSLFVVTGRNSIDWYLDERVELAYAGRQVWPGLVLGTTDGPRQHLLDRLSGSDTHALIVRRREVEGLNISDEVVAELVKSTAGWPVHIDAVATYARRLSRADPSRPLTVKDLGGSLTSVVRNLLDDLPDDERRVFQAACVLPFFDVKLVKSVAAISDTGSVLRCISTALVLENPGSAFPFRVHDEIRAAVRDSSERRRGGWTSDDWSEAAQRAINHAQIGFDAAATRGDDHTQLLSTALAINVAAENDVDLQWIANAIKRGPNITGLRPYIPPSDKIPRTMPVKPVIEFIEALSERAHNGTLNKLADLSSDQSIGIQAGLWRAYRLRYPLKRYEDAITQFEAQIEVDPERTRFYRRQIAVTLIQSRKFRDAEPLVDRLEPTIARRTWAIVKRHHGDLSEVADLEERMRAVTASRRFQIEILGTLAVAKGRLGLISMTELRSHLELVRNVGHRSAERDILKTMGFQQLFRDSEFEETIQTLEAISEKSGDSPAVAELLSLRAIATRRDAFAQRAADHARQVSFRSMTWIPTEMFLSQLGHELPELPTQWVEPIGVVRDRWDVVARSIVAVAEDRA